MDIARLLATYPRQRPPLPEPQQRIYQRELMLNRGGKTLITALTMRAESWMHRQVAHLGKAGTTLELGAGTLNHVPYERERGLLHMLDIVEPVSAYYEHSEYRQAIRNTYRDISEIPRGTQYDRVISIAVLEHLEDLPAVVARSGLLLKGDGLFQHGVPSEGGFSWGLAWRLTTGVSYRLRTGLSYAAVMHHEHINTAPDILSIVRYLFDSVQVRRFPLPLFHLSFYTYIHATGPRKSRCESLLRLR